MMSDHVSRRPALHELWKKREKAYARNKKGSPEEDAILIEMDEAWYSINQAEIEEIERFLRISPRKVVHVHLECFRLARNLGRDTNEDHKLIRNPDFSRSLSTAISRSSSRARSNNRNIRWSIPNRLVTLFTRRDVMKTLVGYDRSWPRYFKLGKYQTRAERESENKVTVADMFARA